jgi:hypothetical protein
MEWLLLGWFVAEAEEHFTRRLDQQDLVVPFGGDDSIHVDPVGYDPVRREKTLRAHALTALRYDSRGP